MRFLQSIDVDFSGLNNARSLLSELTSELQDTLKGNIPFQMKNTLGNWEEESADILIGKEVELYEELLEEAALLKTLIDEIENVSLKVFDAELYGRGLAINRSY